MISAELLDEVLGVKVTSNISIEIDEKHNSKPTLCIFYIYDDVDQFGVCKVYNLYELAHKCKEWANIGKGIYLSSGYNEMDENWEAMMMQRRYYADTEPEAIFKACEWILKGTK